MNHTQQIARVSLVDAVVDRLREEIRAGNWSIGSKIPTEAKLVEAYGVSRTSVREAVRSLVQLGLLETRQGDGTYVVAEDEVSAVLQHAIDAAAENEVLVVRRALDVLAAREAANNRTPDDIEGLRTALAGRRAASAEGNPAAFIDHDVAFHLGVARASKNSLLFGLYQSFERSLRDSVGRANCFAIVDDPHGSVHDDLLLAIEQRDPEAATRAATSVLDDHEQQLHAPRD
ncbi:MULTISPECIES: FadR/GntR family transcriptional regulator [unclassified Mycolicibacterium]|uniref:FadR/GntR family transcriptional regulator n=1 Tax=unclassified Mycolicibacterium TaxID=2636767 RepID=UPI002ED832BA